MKKINRKRLEELKYCLEHYEEWLGKTKFDISIVATENDCGTAACALGAAGLYEPFRKQGFRTIVDEGNSGTVIYCYRGKTYYTIHAGAKFFGIPIETAWSIFSEEGYPKVKQVTPLMVAKKIGKVLKDASTS